MSDSDTTPAKIEDAELVPYSEAEMSKYPALRLETGVGEAYDKAETIDALLADLPDAEGLREYLGRPLTVNGASLRIGEVDGKQTLYTMLDVTDDSTGKSLVLSTGAAAVMRQLNRAAQLDAFPFQCLAYEVEINKRGRSNPIHLGKVDRF